MLQLNLSSIGHGAIMSTQKTFEVSKENVAAEIGALNQEILDAVNGAGSVHIKIDVKW
jgi:hypothetical protein